MTGTCWKATTVAGLDFRTATVDYAAACGSGQPLTPPLPQESEFPGPGWLHLATTPTDCVGMSWPCRLFEVQPVGDVHTDVDLRKIGCRSVLVVAEHPAHLALGPQGEAVAALIDRAGQLTGDEIDRLRAASDAAWDAARYAAWYAARDAARDAASDAAWDAARYAAWYAAWDAASDAASDAARRAASDAARDAAAALLVRDLITDEHYRLLAGAWLEVVGDSLAADAEVVDDPEQEVPR